jgi:hypothetical protein
VPGFSFSPTMRDKHIVLFLKSGKELEGIVKEANPTEVVLQKDDKLIRIDRDQVEAYTGSDNIKRNPDPLRLHLTRCYNMTIKCNGVKKISADPGNIESMKDCPARNESCECFTADFYDMEKHAQIKLLNGLMIGFYPSESKE